MRQYNDDILEQIEHYASIYLPISEMAILLNLNSDELREDISVRSSAVSRAYYKGKAESKVKMLEQEMQLAMVGSPLALENAHRNLLDMEDDE